jgi:hypothetical protein
MDEAGAIAKAQSLNSEVQWNSATKIGNCWQVNGFYPAPPLEGEPEPVIIIVK